MHHLQNTSNSVGDTKGNGNSDWAYKKGDHYGTALVDFEKNQIIEHLPERPIQSKIG